MARDLGIVPKQEAPYYLISYNSEDQDRVSLYARALAKRNLPLWYDKGILVGEEWERVIAQKIRCCEAVIVFLTHGVFQKEESFVHKEYKLAKKQKKKIHVVLLDRIADEEVPDRYAFWWDEVEALQCIESYEPCQAAICAKSLAEALGELPKPPMSTDPQKPRSKKEKRQEESISEEKSWGKLHLMGGDEYVGELSQGKPHGKGELKYRNGDRYEGQFVMGSCTGIGTLSYSDGSQYHGYFLNGEFHGRGRYSSPNGTFYDGEWKEGRHHGKGTRVYANGEKYEGDFFGDYRHGEGKYTYRNGETYEGAFVYNKCSGKGKYTFVNGEVYIGDFENGLFHGSGRLLNRRGEVIREGHWAQGQFKG